MSHTIGGGMSDVKVGALVEVTLHGEVVRQYGDALYIRSGDGIGACSYWIPAGASVTVLKPARPSEVLLLSCGHLSQKQRPDSPSEDVFCVTCMQRQPLEAVGSLSW